MAISAAQFRVGPVQIVSGQCMVKFIGIEADHLEFPAMVVAMAFKTILCPGLSRSVISPSCLDPRGNFFMAIQTLFIGHFFTQKMAFCTV
jgi:hypothetical protein